MKLLVISTWFPYPPDNGSKIRLYNLLKHLTKNHTIDILALSQSECDYQYLDKAANLCRRINIFPEPEFIPAQMKSWLGFLSATPRYFKEHYSPEMESRAIEWSQKEKYDAVLAITLGSAPYISKLDIPFKLLDQHNVESQVIKRQWKNGHSTFEKIRYAPTWIKAERYERRLAMDFDAITVVSEPESILMDNLLRDNTKRIDVITNGVSPDFLDYRHPGREEDTIAFTGALTYEANYDAALRLSSNILPDIQTELPGTKLRITGNTKGIDTSVFNRDGVTLTGYVDDIRSVVASASALVVPLRYGGGTRLKILEAMALGTPVISTPMGAEGIEAKDGIHILIGKTDKELADRTIRLLKDESLAVRISDSARELVNKHYLWPSIAQKFEDILLEEVIS